MVLTAVGDSAYRRPTDAVFVVPIGALELRDNALRTYFHLTFQGKMLE